MQIIGERDHFLISKKLNFIILLMFAIVKYIIFLFA